MYTIKEIRWMRSSIYLESWQEEKSLSSSWAFCFPQYYKDSIIIIILLLLLLLILFRQVEKLSLPRFPILQESALEFSLSPPSPSLFLSIFYLFFLSFYLKLINLRKKETCSLPLLTSLMSSKQCSPTYARPHPI